MNRLNQVILEGVVTSKQENMISLADGTTPTVLMLVSTRYFKDENGEKCEEKSAFEVRAYGRMKESVNNLAHIGRSIRVVGSLKQLKFDNGTSTVFVIAQHIEYMPFRKE